MVSDADLRTHLRIAADGTENGLMAAYRAAAHQAAEHYTGAAIGSQTLELALDAFPDEIPLPRGKVTSITSITYKDTAVVTPNSDTPYSILWLDLRAEPMIISVPAVPAPRYYSVQLIDGNTFNYGYIGSRATGTEAGDYMVVGPGWKGETPAGVKGTFESSTDFSLTLFRTQLFTPDDMPNVAKVQAGYKVQPLSAFLGQPAPPAAPHATLEASDSPVGTGCNPPSAPPSSAEPPTVLTPGIAAVGSVVIAPAPM